jgi:hypothetical protein
MPGEQELLPFVFPSASARAALPMCVTHDALYSLFATPRHPTAAAPRSIDLATHAGSKGAGTLSGPRDIHSRSWNWNAQSQRQARSLMHNAFLCRTHLNQVMRLFNSSICGLTSTPFYVRVNVSNPASSFWHQQIGQKGKRAKGQKGKRAEASHGEAVGNPPLDPNEAIGKFCFVASCGGQASSISMNMAPSPRQSVPRPRVKTGSSL